MRTKDLNHYLSYLLIAQKHSEITEKELNKQLKNYKENPTNYNPNK